MLLLLGGTVHSLQPDSRLEQAVQLAYEGAKVHRILRAVVHRQLLAIKLKHGVDDFNGNIVQRSEQALTDLYIHTSGKVWVNYNQTRIDQPRQPAVRRALSVGGGFFPK